MKKAWICFVNAFVKVTGIIPELILFHEKVIYQEGAMSRFKIKGPLMIICNHTSLIDFALMLFLFPFRIVRWQAAEVMINKKVVGPLIRGLGCIAVDRTAKDFSFLRESADILEDNGIVGIFPEARLPLPGEERPLEFKPSAAYLALMTGVTVIPVYTNGMYFKNPGKRCRAVIGRPFTAEELSDPSLSEKDNIDHVSRAMRDKIIELSLIEKGGAR